MDHLTVARNVLKLEARAIDDVSSRLDESFSKAVELMYACKGRVIVLGMGKCFHIARKIAATLASTGTPAFAIHPGEAFHGDLGMVMKGDVVLALSNSGETGEVTAILPCLRQRGAKLIAMTGRKDSTLAKAADEFISSYVPKEACSFGMVPTCSSTVQLALGDALAMALVEKRDFTEKDFALLHPGGALGRKMMKVEQLMRTGERLCKVSPDTIVRDVVVLMTKTKNGAACVVDSDGKLCGFFTDGDFRRTMLNDPEAIMQPVSTVMIKEPHTITPGYLASEAAEIMGGTVKKFSQLPVVDENGKLLGLLDDDELIGM